MKKNDVQIGATYLVKVASNLVPVKITREYDSGGGGWEGTSVKTGKTIRIKTAQRLRKPLADTAHGAAKADKPTKDAKAEPGRDTGERGATDGYSDDDEPVTVFRASKGGAYHWRRGSLTNAKRYMARDQAERAAAKANPGATIRFAGATTSTATGDTKPKPQRDTGERAATGGQREAEDAKPMSLLDAAAHLLSLGTGDPMRCKDIVDLAVDRGLWALRDGKTPANTLYAAIASEIKTKGEASRFVKAERGKFALASKA